MGFAAAAIASLGVDAGREFGINRLKAVAAGLLGEERAVHGVAEEYEMRRVRL